MIPYTDVIYGPCRYGGHSFVACIVMAHADLAPKRAVECPREHRAGLGRLVDDHAQVPWRVSAQIPEHVVHPWYAVMAYIVMAYTVIAYIVMAYIVMSYIDMAYIVMSYIDMAYIVMADILYAYRSWRLCPSA